MIKLDAINYLSSICGKQPNSRYCIGFDGERLGVIAFSVIDAVISHQMEKVAYVWFADRYENVGMSRSLDLLGDLSRIGLGTAISQTSIYAKGQRFGVWSFAKQARKNHDVKVIEFEKKSQGHWSSEEIIMAVKDDMSEGLILPAPEFKGRPEYENLNATLRNLKLTPNLDVLAEAAVYGLGYWSTIERRQKYKLGRGFDIY